jgi:hypothetical protein
MRTKSFQIVLATSVFFAFLAQLAGAKSNSPAHLGRDHVAPVVALEEATALMAHTSQPAVSDSELEMFKKVAAGDLKGFSETDAILTAANITDPESRKRYSAKLDKITEQARKAIADAKTPADKADKLVDFLFNNTLHGGYEEGQVDMRKVLDKGKFNCVSSCVLFNLIGRHLGLKTRCVTIPTHVFLRMDDVYIEPVAGFTANAKIHDEVVVDKIWAKAADYWKTVFGTARTFESGNLGLIGAIYVDKSIILSRDNKHVEETVVAALKASCLEPKHPVFAHQLESAVHDWFNDTLKQKQYTKAQKIAAIYGQLFGDSSSKLFDQLADARNHRTVKG